LPSEIEGMTKGDPQQSVSEQSEPAKANATPKLIAELLISPDFPRSAMGEWVDIGGYVGVVVDVVRQSLKVRSSDGVTRSFNSAGLLKLYGPRVLVEPLGGAAAHHPEVEEVAFEPHRDMVEVPDFSKPVRKISDFVRDPNFPRSALGEHVDVNGYVGVVVEIVHRSLKVRSQAETTRSYNADVLRKLHGA